MIQTLFKWVLKISVVKEVAAACADLLKVIKGKEMVKDGETYSWGLLESHWP